MNNDKRDADPIAAVETFLERHDHDDCSLLADDEQAIRAVLTELKELRKLFDSAETFKMRIVTGEEDFEIHGFRSPDFDEWRVSVVGMNDGGYVEKKGDERFYDSPLEAFKALQGDKQDDVS